MKINFLKNFKEVASSSIIIVPVFADKKSTFIPSFINKDSVESIENAISCFDFGPKDAKVLYLKDNEGNNLTVGLLGLGDKEKWATKSFAIACRRAISLAKAEKTENIYLDVDSLKAPGSPEDVVQMAATQLIIADFTFNKYKEIPKGGWPKVESVFLLVGKPSESLEDSLKTGIIIGEEINKCRELANTPGSDMTPKMLADHAVKEGKKSGFKVKILEEAAIEKLGMGGVIGVSKGSSEKPRFVIAEYLKGPKSQKPIVFVGKGVTFDSGGLNIKPSAHIYEMHMDMSGGAAVIHALGAIARAKLKVNVIALVPAVENMPSGSSYRPGDILKTITGKTIEVLNTDAEGRVILADGLGYAQKYKPELIVDVATLTGGAMVALGQRAIALFTNRDSLEKDFRELGDKTAEPVWPLPVWDEYLEDIKSTFGDVANDGHTRYGAPIQGAIFLKQFIGDYPWVHLDICPTMTSIDGQYLAKGASGTSVALLFALAKQYYK